MMYELSLTALVEGKDLDAACSVLEGLCGMPPWQTIHRVLYYQGPPKPKGVSTQSSATKSASKETPTLWKELQQSLSKQSFILQLRYELLKDRDFGGASSALALDSSQGVLRWTDFPDPPHGRPMIIQRKKIELWDQKKLPVLMTEIDYRFKTETIEEVYRFYRNEVEFCLWRLLLPRPAGDFNPLITQAHPTPLSNLPAWEGLLPMDMQNRWILQVKAHVLQDHKPDELRKCQDQLLAIKTELDGVFDFRNIDRKAQDTRVAQQQQGIQALPQKVTLRT